MRISLVAILVSYVCLPYCFAQAPVTTPPPTPPTAEQIKAAANMPFRSPNLPIEKRVDDLVSRLTLEEKVSQLIDRAEPVPRLDIPAYNWWNEGLHGIAREEGCTVQWRRIVTADLDTPITDRDEVTIMQALSGG